MKNVVIAGICFIALGVCAPIMAQPEEVNWPPVSQTDEMTPYVPKMMDAPFSFSYPGNWYLREEYLGGGRAGVYVSPAPIQSFNDIYATGVVLTMKPGYYKDSMPNFDQEAESLVERYSKRGMRKWNKIDLGGTKAVWVYIEDNGTAYEVIAQRRSSHLFLIEFRAPSLDYERLRPVFAAIRESFSWTPVRKAVDSYDRFTEALINDETSDVVYNGTRLENVRVRDVAKSFVDGTDPSKISSDK